MHSRPYEVAGPETFQIVLGYILWTDLGILKAHQLGNEIG